MDNIEKKLFSIVIPVYQNELNLPTTISYIISKKDFLFPTFRVELILVNDGSKDNSYKVMKYYQKQYPETIKIVSFTRNFGQMAATSYGIKVAAGNVVGVISADLQDPFDLFADMLAEWENGYELVFATRKDRAEKGLGIIFSKITNKLVNKFIDKRFPEGGYDFYLMDRKVVNEFVKISEKNGWPQVLLLWLGHKSKQIEYVREKREVGKSGWNYAKKIKLFIDIFTTNSYFPLRLMSASGMFFSAVAFIYVLFIVIRTLIWSSPVQGWTSLAALITFFSGVILLSFGILGEYIWRIFDYVKGRPECVVEEIIDATECREDI